MVMVCTNAFNLGINTVFPKTNTIYRLPYILVYKQIRFTVYINADRLNVNKHCYFINK